MPARTTYRGPDWRRDAERRIAAVERAQMGAAAEWVEGLKDENRDQVVAAGLGPRLANAWRGKVYPEGATRSANPAGIVYVTPGKGRTGSGPRIIDFFSSQKVVRPLFGRAMAIPSDDVPRTRGGRPMTVDEAEAVYGKRLVFIDARHGRFSTPSARKASTIGWLVLKDLVIRKATQRWRNRTARERERGREGFTVILFTLVRQVTSRALLSPDETYRRWVAAYPGLVERHFEIHSRGL